ncbi:MAG: NTP transferase domain-containing protein [Candidatus Aenigmarchaeota archaeon]|nr:NTP transferase domain-containing protein [Candidatus Aenigmarchaeota archaeon]
MKAVILCAGKSTRAHPLTVNRPKCMVKFAGKTLLEHILDSIVGLIDEVILVVGFGKEMVKKKIGYEYRRMEITYVEQEKPMGTAHALLQAKEKVENDPWFIVMMGDNLYPRVSVEDMLGYGVSILGQKIERPQDYGTLDVERGFLVKIEEKPGKPKSDLVNTGLYVLNNRIFDAICKIRKSKRNEYELTDAVNLMLKDIRMRCFYTREWIPVTYPWDVLKANQCILSKIKGGKRGKVEKNVVVKGNVYIGEGTVIKSGTYIEGPAYIGKNCIIGPNAYIRANTSIGDNCKIRAEVVNSVIMDNVNAKHFSYIGHSVVGENVNIAAGTVTADFRHDGRTHITIVKGKKIDTGLHKLGAFIGDDVRTGINTSIYPGRKLWPDTSTLPGEVVKSDKVK